jgi:hypothetical protein
MYFLGSLLDMWGQKRPRKEKEREINFSFKY